MLPRLPLVGMPIQPSRPEPPMMAYQPTVFHRATFYLAGKGWWWKCTCGSDVHKERFVSRDAAAIDHDHHVLSSDWSVIRQDFPI